ncbi:hypothetical protein FGO68_gene7081 [Halteria grandinella]|uniref:Uncharacterized protein n=1 Tax=Halteria grandinella TaxID=5974 RepID=A0A8J8T013_HALGN|nr:hypothetical protein FGO68_gene7081 [Halteria grandinella]
MRVRYTFQGLKCDLCHQLPPFEIDELAQLLICQACNYQIKSGQMTPPTPHFDSKMIINVVRKYKWRWDDFFAKVQKYSESAKANVKRYTAFEKFSLKFQDIGIRLEKLNQLK